MPTATDSKDMDFNPKHESMDVANNLMKIGEIYLEIGGMSTAIEDFFEACNIFASMFGKSATECTETFHSHGKALLAMSRLERRTPYNAVKGVKIKEDLTEGEQLEGTTTKIETGHPQLLEEPEALKLEET